ncbi:MAG: Do family serine endopeptidase [Nitrospirae bacterium]|nr:Do family serine endopeptidase [Nitrospirota bacterium]
MRFRPLAIHALLAAALLFPATAQAKAAEGVELLESIENVFVEVADMVRTGVVSIAPTEADMQAAMRAPHGFPPGIPGHPPQNPHGETPPPDAPPQPDNSPGSGTGVILDQDGHVATNAHVVGDAQEMEVQLSDGRRYAARVVGRDQDTDLAVLVLTRPDGDSALPVLPLGDSDKVRPGQWAIAVGNPFGLERTVTVGIVSGVGREGVNLTRYENFIQTDAPINPGNSGGPLFNVRGEVIGINTAIMSFAQGIGFAIPVNMMKQVTGQIITHGTVQRGWLGVGIQNIGRDLAETFGVKEDSGVLVNEVFADQPAARSGIQPGDIILSLNDVPVTSPNTLARLIAALDPDSEARITYLRDGAEHTVSTVLGHRDQVPQFAAASAPERDLGALLGLDLQALTPELAEQLGMDGAGLLVARVAPDGPSFGRGVQEGDVIREVNRTPVGNLDELNAALTNRKPGAKVLLRLTRQGSGRYVVLSPDEAR